MISLGYMYKRIDHRPEWLGAPSVLAIYSVSGCCSEYFCDYINFWKHNGYWLFDSPEIMREIAAESSIDMSDCKLFFYQAYEEEFDQDERVWRAYEPNPSFQTDVIEPQASSLEGFDVCTFSRVNDPECSPLSCNYLATKLAVNRHCLFDSFIDAREAVEAGQFSNTEPGSLRIVAVYSVTV